MVKINANFASGRGELPSPPADFIHHRYVQTPCVEQPLSPARPLPSPKYSLDRKIDTYGGRKVGGKSVLIVLNQKGRFPDSRVSNYQDLVHVVEVRVHGCVQAFLLRHFLKKTTVQIVPSNIMYPNKLCIQR